MNEKISRSSTGSVLSQSLPRLVYIGDVPIESTYHGSILLYRLFESYPADRLLIIETDLGRSAPERRLANVQYRHLALFGRELARTRLSGLYAILLCFLARFRIEQLRRAPGRFQPDAVISVAHGYHWIAAARFAAQLRLPFYLVVHDHPVQVTRLPNFLRGFFSQDFGAAYRQAAVRFCVSPYMEAEYRARYGVPGSVLFPSRAPDGPEWDEPPKRDPNVRTLRFAFAGTINSGGYARLLKLLTEVFEQGDKLVLFGPHTSESLRYWNLEAENIELAGLLPANELLHRLRTEFDVLFVPMSFEVAGHADNMRMGFPSKIADYTATGVPLLICGPDYCSAVRWAREWEDVAEVVTSEQPGELAKAVERLRSVRYRELLAGRALEIGNRLFSYSAVETAFLTELAKQ